MSVSSESNPPELLDPFQMAFDHSSVSRTLNTLDGAFLRVNHAMVKLFGYTQEELIGAHFGKLTHPDDLATSDELVRCLKAGERDAHQLEKRCLHRNGKVIWTLLSISLMRDTGGHPLYFTTDVIDITEQKRSNDQLKRLAAIVSASDDAVFSKDLTGLITQWNTSAEKLYGYTAEEALGQSVLILSPPEYDDETLSLLQRVHQGEVIKRFETQRKHKDGTLINVSLTVFPMHNDSRAIIGSSSIARDITTRKQSESALLHSHRVNRTLRLCNEALFRADNERHLFQQICDIVIKESGYRLCWVGKAEHDESFSVRVVSQSGFDEGYLNQANITWADSERGQGPVGTCIRTQQPVFVRHIAQDSSMLPWQEAALKHHLASCIAIPLITEGIAFGALTIYADGPEAFSDEEVKLLTELANDIGFGILMLRTQKEHAKARDDLKKSQKLLNDSQRIAKVGGWEYDLATGHVLWTDEVYRIHGLAKTYSPRYFGQALQFYLPKDQQRLDEAFQRAVEHGESYDLELQLKTAQGQAIWVRTNGHTEYQDEKVTRVYGNIIDITKRKQAEASLRESELRYRSLFEGAGEGIMTVDFATMKILHVNQAMCHMLGYTAEELRGFELFSQVGKGKAKEVESTFLKLAHSDEAIQKEVPLIHKNGKLIDARITSTRVIINDRLCITGFFTDITQHKEAEAEHQRLLEQLNHAQKMEAVGRLAGGVAHDFNNMLSVIQGYSELALMQVKEGERLFRALSEIHNATVRSAALTRQLLAFARKQPSNPSKLNLNDTVAGMLRMLRRLIGEDIELLWQPSPELRQILFDPSQVDQILANLIVNARDAIQGVGKVTIETANVSLDENYCHKHADSSPGDYVRLTVSDSGCGMSKELMTQVFDPFFTTKAKGAGTGLGLSTVYGIVKQNKGLIYVYSEPGLGSTFKIYLPVVLPPTEQKVAAIKEATIGGNETVLLVDDEPGILSMAKEVLVEYGYQIITADSPIEALVLAAEYPQAIDLLLTDVIMPNMNGKELSQQMTTQRPKLRTLYMSGYTDNVIAANHTLAKDVAFLQKPFSVQTLLTKVRQVLDAGANAET